MELKEAKHLDNLLRRANRSVINIDNVDGESIDTLIDRDLIEVVDKRDGVTPYLIKISQRGRDFLASGGFCGEVKLEIERKDEDGSKKKEKTLNTWVAYIGIIVGVATIVALILDHL
jgi:hypothetical protein